MQNISTKFNLPLSALKIPGRLFHIDSEIVAYYGNHGLSVLLSRELTSPLFDCIMEERGHAFYRRKDQILFHDNTSITTTGQLMRLDLNKRMVFEISAKGLFTSGIFLKANEDIGYFKTDFKKISKIDLSDFSVIAETEKYRRSSNAVALDFGFSMKTQNDLMLFDESLSLFSSMNVPSALADKSLKLEPVIGAHKEDVLVQLTNSSLVSCKLSSGAVNWKTDECLSNKWCIGNEGKVYSVFKGSLKTVDAETGDLLLDKPIDADWVQAEKDTLNLFQVNVSSTHLWCGFLGHGLCAINLKTAKIDWHDFDGQTINRKPIIKNNRIYVQLMAGGIGLDNAGVQEYILEGEGGYLEESDNEFVVF